MKNLTELGKKKKIAPQRGCGPQVVAHGACEQDRAPPGRHQHSQTTDLQTHRTTTLKSSQLHMRYIQSLTHASTHVKRTEGKDVTTPSTPTTRRVGSLPQCHPGLCGTPVGPGKDTHGTPVPERRGRGWPGTTSTRQLPTNNNKTKTSLESNVFLATGVVIHLESYMVAEQRDDHMADESKWRSPGSSSRSRREKKPITQEKITQVSCPSRFLRWNETKHTEWNETKHIKIP